MGADNTNKEVLNMMRIMFSHFEKLIEGQEKNE